MMKKYLNTKKTKFLCPRCSYYERNDFYKSFPSLHWTSDLVPLSELEAVLSGGRKQNENGKEENEGDDVDMDMDDGPILCHCDVVNGVTRLVSWIKVWQQDVN